MPHIFPPFKYGLSTILRKHSHRTIAVHSNNVSEVKMLWCRCSWLQKSSQQPTMELPHWKRQLWLIRLKTAGVGRPRVKSGFEITLKIWPTLKLQALILSLDTITRDCLWTKTLQPNSCLILLNYCLRSFWHGRILPAQYCYFNINLHKTRLLKFSY